jgi:hypothetical protein
MGGLETLLGTAGTIATTLKSYIDVAKGLREVMPDGKERDELDRELKNAEEGLARTDAQLVQQLGYTLCRCTFPPTPMLYKRDQSANVCPNCGETEKVLRPEDFATTAIKDYDPFEWMR